jgi:hypothetical protein
MISINYNEVLHHLSEQGTSSIWYHFLPNAHIANLIESAPWDVTELTSSMVAEPVFAILMRKGSCGIIKVSSHMIFIFNN